jgi:hypothetical protein
MRAVSVRPAVLRGGAGAVAATSSASVVGSSSSATTTTSSSAAATARLVRIDLGLKCGDGCRKGRHLLEHLCVVLG